MKIRRLLGAIACMGLLLPGLMHAQSDSVAARHQIEPLLHELLLAANAHDTDRYMSVYLRDPTFVMAYSGNIATGWDSVRTLQLKWWNNGKSDVVYSVHDAPAFTALGPDVMLVATRWGSSRTRPDGQTATSILAITMVWHKLPEGWRVVQVHESATRG
jgi:ketosteroid isomerase-like protein